MSTADVLRLQGVHKTYRLGLHVVQALQGVDLVLRPGEMLALTGPSGSGKSTLLNLAGLIDAPDAGRILLQGADVTHLDDAHRDWLVAQMRGWRAEGATVLFTTHDRAAIRGLADQALWLRGGKVCAEPAALAREVAA